MDSITDIAIDAGLDILGQPQRLKKSRMCLNAWFGLVFEEQRSAQRDDNLDTSLKQSGNVIICSPHRDSSCARFYLECEPVNDAKS